MDFTTAARILADHGHTNPDAVTLADLIAAADLAGLGYPSRGEQDDIRDALAEVLS